LDTEGIGPNAVIRSVYRAASALNGDANILEEGGRTSLARFSMTNNHDNNVDIS
jgi:hypothetical protein